MSSTMKRLALIVAALAAIFGPGAGAAQAHTPKCTAVYDDQAGIYSVTGGQYPVVKYQWVLTNCPTTVDKVQVNGSSPSGNTCGTFVTQYLGEINGDQCVPYDEHVIVNHNTVVTSTSRVVCYNGLTQYIRAGTVHWFEHWTSFPGGGGPGWTESFDYALPTTFQTIFACGW